MIYEIVATTCSILPLSCLLTLSSLLLLLDTTKPRISWSETWNINICSFTLALYTTHIYLIHMFVYI